MDRDVLYSVWSELNEHLAVTTRDAIMEHRQKSKELKQAVEEQRQVVEDLCRKYEKYHSTAERKKRFEEAKDAINRRAEELHDENERASIIETLNIDPSTLEAVRLAREERDNEALDLRDEWVRLYDDERIEARHAFIWRRRSETKKRPRASSC